METTEQCLDHPESKSCRHYLVTFDPDAPASRRAESCAAAQILNQVSASWVSLNTKGTRPQELQQAADELASRTLSPELTGPATGLIAATSRILGVSADRVSSALERTRSLTAAEHNREVSESSCKSKRQRRVDAYPLEIVYRFYHIHEKEDGDPLPDYSDLVRLNKNQTRRWKGRGANVAGKHRILTCVPKVREASLADLAEEYLHSETHGRIVRENPALSIDASTVQSCVCVCIKEDVVDEFSCPTCTSFECVLQGLSKACAARRRRVPCGACDVWVQALKSTEALSEAGMCARRPLLGYALQDAGELIIRPVECCLNAPFGSVKPCEKCGVRKLVPLCSCMSDDALSEECAWIKKQPTVEGKNHDVVKDRFRRYRGTVGEALETVLSTHRDPQFHLWRNFYIRRQYRLEAIYFDQDTECVITCDFASAMILGAGFRSVCESDST